ncbi:unnamed protein product [Alopecurus aequalis]
MDALEHHHVLVDILRHLPPRRLAACRCVRTAWRATIDDHRLLRAAELPLSPHGIFYETIAMDIPKLFCRPSTASHVAATFRALDGPLSKPVLMDCCNGLLLLYYHVLNPATSQMIQLPPLPGSCTYSDCTRCDDNQYILYDPTLSSHYEVFLIPTIPCVLPSEHISRHICHGGGPVYAMEWPPSPFIMHVFSSKTMLWEKRSFVRQGKAAGTVIHIKSPTFEESLYHAAYWREALYVRCADGFVLRINKGNDTYRVIKLPYGKHGTPRLGKSKNGVYCALLYRPCSFEIWFLDESSEKMKWVLKNRISLEPVKKYSRTNYADEQWILESCDPLEHVSKNGAKLDRVEDKDEALLVEDDVEWNSDDEDTIDTAEWPTKCSHNAHIFSCLGFHPYKKIVFFNGGGSTVAYHFNSSKIRHLGTMEDGRYSDMVESFPYAPCCVRNLPGSNN